MARPTLRDRLEEIRVEEGLTNESLYGMIGITRNAFYSFRRDPNYVNNEVLEKIRNFVEKPKTRKGKKKRKVSKSSTTGDKVSIDILRRLQTVEFETLEKVIGVMEALNHQTVSLDELEILVGAFTE